ncbi:sulfite exporter TauE/SafE family protein [Chelatococcus sp. GCM10030263]|uniref:sulfite exporter TauE/SafE family protein n=1 Tax=Chelatococcus sp. GCM10030263 TaxID=3273387 RepID=UPI00361EAE66
MVSDPVFYLAAVPAVIIGGLSKGGFVGLGSVAQPLMALTVPSFQAAAILLPILVMQDWVGVFAYRRFYDGRTLAILLPGALLGTLLGTLAATVVSDAYVRLAVGLISIVFSANWWLGLSKEAAKAKPGGVLAGLFWGAVSGLTSFVSHAGGPPFQIYVLPQRLPRDILVGTTSWFFASVNLFKVIPYLWLGQFTRENLLTSAALLPLAVASTVAGVWLVRRMRSDGFYRVIYALLFMVGLKLVYDGIVGLL